MIPILFDATETNFTSNGIGRLTDAVKCEVTEERNGQYELVMQYPIEGELFAEIVPGRYIFATHDEGKVPQAFQIYQISLPLQGLITVNAWHISYALNTIIVEPFTAGSCSQAIAGLSTHSMNTNPFTFWTDKQVTADFALNIPASVRAVLGGMSGSILDVYGKGEYEFDMYMVKLHLNRGANRGVSIRYGKNLTKLDQTLDASNIYNSVVPYWTNGETSVVSDVVITKAGESVGNTIALDLSGEFDEAPTLVELKAKAQTIVDNSNNYTLKENLKVDFVALWQTDEYENYASLERVYLCDTVNIYYEKSGVNVTAQCIKVVYDTLRERYTSIELGEPSTSLIQQIRTEVVGDVLENVPSKSQMQAAIDHATELIGGGFGGYIKFNYLSDGTPSEMLVMDSPSESTATNIIRLNQNGLGFSTDGGSTYANAWTIDGNLNASFITTGILDADLMTAGMIQDSSGENYWNLDTGEFVTKQGEIADFSIMSDQLLNGEIGVHKYGTRLKAGSFAMSNWKPYHIGGGVYENYTTLMNHNHGGMQFTFTKDADGTSKILGGIDTDVTVINSDIFPFLQFGSSSANMSVYTADYVGSRLIFHGTANFVNNVTLSSSAVLRANGGISGGAYNAPSSVDMYGNLTLRNTQNGDGNITAGGMIRANNGFYAEATNDILASAVAQDTSNGNAKWYVLGGDSYTGTMPANQYRYGVGFVIKRHVSDIRVVVFPQANAEPITNFYSGSWTGWSAIHIQPYTVSQKANNGGFSPAAANTWYEVPSLSLTAPVAGLYLIRAYATYNNAMPTGIAIVTRDASRSYTDYIAITDRSSAGLGGTTQYLYTSGIQRMAAGDVALVYAKYGSASINNNVGLEMYPISFNA